MKRLPLLLLQAVGLPLALGIASFLIADHLQAETDTATILSALLAIVVWFTVQLTILVSQTASIRELLERAQLTALVAQTANILEFLERARDVLPMALQLTKIQSMANERAAACGRHWRQLQRDIENFGNGVLNIHNREWLFLLKAECLGALSQGEQFCSTVVPSDIEAKVFRLPKGFPPYEESIYTAAARGIPCRRLFIFPSQAWFDDPDCQAHLEKMHKRNVEVRYTILEGEGSKHRFDFEKSDFAIFGSDSVAQLHPKDIYPDYATLSFRSQDVGRAQAAFNGLWGPGTPFNPRVDGSVNAE